jgi:NADH-quinone oxidoreductase subunit G
MHLINHPVDCPICDQAGECGLQDQYMKYGLYESEVEKADKVHKDKAEVIGPHVILDKERCVLCSRCVRFCEEVTGTGEMGIFRRGDRAEIGIAPGRELNNNYSLNTVDICPVGALTSRDFRFVKRVWLLKSTSAVCPGCSTGCNVRVDHEADRIYRLKPRRNDAVNGPWMCDLGRMEYRGVHTETRLAAPLLRREGVLTEATWPELRDALAAVKGWRAAVLSPWQSLEEAALFARLAEALGAELGGGPATAARGEGDALLLDADRSPNRAGLALLGVTDRAPAELDKRFEGAVLVYGGDPLAQAPGLAAAPLVYLGTHRNATAEAADVVVPLAAWAEKDALWVNRNERVQRGRRAVAWPGEAQEDWRFLADWLRDLGVPDVPEGLPALRRWTAARCGRLDGIDLNNLPADGCLPAGAAVDAGGDR